MRLERPELFQTSRDWLLFFVLMALTALIALGLEYHRYAALKTFTTAHLDVRVVHQYSKHGQTLLKVKSTDGPLFFMKADRSVRNLEGYTLRIDAYTGRTGFLDYLQGGYVTARIIKVYPGRASRYEVADRIAGQHGSREVGALFAALAVATPIPGDMRQQLSALGVSHLVAISGFHLGLIALLFFTLFKPLYALAHRRWFPYRHADRDIFLAVATVLLGYVIYLEYVPSVLRAFAMLVIGYLLHDRGIKIVSFQTLSVSVVLLLALFPRLAFSTGFGLSVAGVFFITLFLHRFSTWKRWQQFIGIHVWVYGMMLPLSLSLFGTFDRFHPLSVVWTMLFPLFYPLAAGLHLIGEGALLEGVIGWLMSLPSVEQVALSPVVTAAHGAAALLAVRYRWAVWLLLLFTFAIVVYAVDQVA